MPGGAEFLKKRLLVCPHLKGAGHHGIDTAMARLERRCVWNRDEQVKHRKLMSTWTGPWRVANDDNEHVYAVQHLVTAELRDVDVAMMRFYADDLLEITDEFLKVFHQLENQGEYNIRSILAIKRAARGDEFVVKVAWEGLEETKSTWSRCRACSTTRRPCCAKR